MKKFILYSSIFFLTVLAVGIPSFLFSMRQIISNNKENELYKTLEMERIKLEASISNEIVVVLKMSKSPLIRRYFSNPEDGELQYMAFEELYSYKLALESDIVFWINDNDKLFYYNYNVPYRVDPRKSENYWYHLTLYETPDYNFNINYNPDLDIVRLWINAPVFAPDSVPVGIVGTGIDVYTFVDRLYDGKESKASVYFFNAAGEVTGAQNIRHVTEKRSIDNVLGVNVSEVAQNLTAGEIKILNTRIGKVAVGSIPLLNWYSAAHLPNNLSDYKTALTVLFVLMLIVIAMTVVVFNLIVSSLLRPLHRSIVEARSANRAKSEFLAVMSHEIRTPMNSIMGFAELAAYCNDPSRVKGYLAKITDSTKWLLHIINDILDISKIESGKMELEKTSFDLAAVISRCQSVTQPNAKEKGLEFEVFVYSASKKLLIGDPVRIYQVIVNLLSNAVKFTDKGKIRLVSECKILPDGKAVLRIEVKDTGIGMNSRQLSKVFAPFMQADLSTTRNYGGTGLGLAIVKNIIELMGGKLAVESELGVGTTFSFEIFLDAVDAGEVLPEDKKDIIEKPHFSGLVLVCDDNEMNRLVICDHLERLGLKTVVAENGREAVETVFNSKTKFDLIFMDIFMPEMDGIAAARAIIAAGVETPIIAMTANVMSSEIENYKRNGMPDFLGKPFESQQLWRLLLKYLKQKENHVQCIDC